MITSELTEMITSLRWPRRGVERVTARALPRHEHYHFDGLPLPATELSLTAHISLVMRCMDIVALRRGGEKEARVSS